MPGERQSQEIPILASEVHSELEKIEKGIPTTERVVPERKILTSREITVKFNLRKLAVPLSAVIVLAVAGVLLWKFIPHAAAPAAAPKIENSIAVISFQNQTGDGSRLSSGGHPQPPDHRAGAGGRRLRRLLGKAGGPPQTAGQSNVKPSTKTWAFGCAGWRASILVLGSFVKAENTFVTDVKVLDAEKKTILKTA